MPPPMPTRPDKKPNTAPASSIMHKDGNFIFAGFMVRFVGDEQIDCGD